MLRSQILEPSLVITDEAHTKSKEFQQALLELLIEYVRGKSELESIPKVVTNGNNDGAEIKPNFVEILKVLDPIHLGALRFFLKGRKDNVGIFSPTTFGKSTPTTLLMLCPILLSPVMALALSAAALALGYNCYTQYAHQSLVKQRVVWLLNDIETLVALDPAMPDPIEPPKQSWGLFNLFRQKTPEVKPVIEKQQNEESTALLKTPS